MHDLPKISVVLPVYNGEKYLYNAINSVLTQSFESFELIVINDGSDDKSEGIIKSFDDPRVIYVKNEINLGLIKTLNKGLEIARGKYLARMDADDICAVHRFAIQFNFMERHPDYVMCGSWAKQIDDKGVVTGKIKRIDSSELIKVNMLFTTPFIHPTVMIKTKVLQAFQYDLKAKHCEDMELWPRLAQQKDYKFHNIKKFLIQYRVHTENISVIHLEHQNNSRITVLSPYLENLIERPLTDAEKRIHFLSFNLKFAKIVDKDLPHTNDWFKFLSKTNAQRKTFSKNDFDALLFSRWVVLCLKTKQYFKLFSIGLKWYNPEILYKTMKLLLYK